MTAIVGVMDGSEVLFGADSACTVDDSTASLDVTDDGKLFENGPMLFGYCGSGRMGQLLEFSLVVPKKKRSQTPLGYMSTTFMDAVRDCLKRGGYAGITKFDHKDGEEVGGEFLVAFDRNLFIVQEDYQVLQPRLPFAAIGCAAPIAHGAMFSLRRENAMISARKLAERALEASERYSAGVRGPFRFKRKSFAKPTTTK